MRGVDAAWLTLHTAVNPMVITAVLRFAEPLSADRLRRLVRERLLAPYPGFARRAVPPRSVFDEPVWEDAAVDLDHHVVPVQLLGPGDDAALLSVVGDLMSTPVDLTRPPWQLHLVEGYGRGCAVVARLHHCIADGMALARVLLDLTDDVGPVPVDSAVVASVPGSTVVGRGSAVPVRRALEAAVEALKVGGVVEGAGGPARRALAAVRFGVTVAAPVLRIVLLPPDPRTALSGRLGARKHAAWTRPVDLDEVKRAAKRLDASVNDVLLAATAGALRRYLLARGGRARDVRVFVPVDLRRRGEPVGRDLGNRFGVVVVRLPVGEPDADERVRVVGARVRALRASAEAAAAYLVVNILAALPAWARTVAMRILGAKVSAIVTNVPGPSTPVRMAGALASNVVFWVPQTGSVGVGVSIFSYAGSVTVGVAADAGIVPDPTEIARHVEAELAALIG